MTYYRVYLQRLYNDMPAMGYVDSNWQFINQDPDLWLKDRNAESTSGPWRIKYIHIISKEDYDAMKIYTKPIEQIIFH